MNEIYHHGVRGMRWGVRRYQNKDGTLTKLGVQRLNNNYKNPKFDSETGKYKSPQHEAEVKRGIHALVAQDYNTANKGLKSGSALANQAGNFLSNVRSNATRRKIEKMDFKNVTDAELKSYVNRANLERQVKSIKAEEMDSGRHSIETILEYAGAAMGIAASAAAIYETVHRLQS